MKLWKLSHLARFFPLLRAIDSFDDWNPDAEDAVLDRVLPDCEPVDVDPPELPFRPVFIDMREEASTAKYRHNGKLKISYFRARRLSGVSKCVTWHQTGVERDVDSKRYHLISSHYAIRRDGAVLWLFDHDVRLLTSNSLDRSPLHSIGVEMCGNFEGEDGSGRWWSPDRMGKGRATEAQLKSAEWLLDRIRTMTADEGGEITHCFPHRVSGRNSKGKPNRPICPGSRIWSHIEDLSLQRGMSVPGPKEKFGGSTIPLEWRSGRWLDDQELSGAA